MIVRRSRRWSAKLTTLTAIVLVAAAASYASRSTVLADWLKLRGYTPDTTIVSLADDTAMTAKARHLFYLNHPAVQDKSAFRQSCPQYDEQTIVIGCYQPGQSGIYVLKVTDDRLKGVEEVTAAHEMLHAAYERLSSREKSHVDGLLENYAAHSLTNERIKAALEGYKKSEPGQQANEMHSMFGTEIADLPSELQTYYSQYFSDRQKVVADAEAYQAAFTSRQASIQQYDSQLADLNAQITSYKARLSQQSEAIENQRRTLEAYRSSGDIASYNNGVAPFNNQVNTYNDLLQTTRGLISRYNTIVEERNAIAAQTVQLQQAISSSSLPQSQ